MIRALLLIFDPANTWERIETAKDSAWRVFFMYVLPVMLLSFAVEGWLISRFGVEQGRFAQRIVPVSQELIVRYELAQMAAGLVICFVGALLVKKLGQSFHRRHSYAECFAALGYSLGPYFLCRMLDGWPVLNTWIAWAIGALLAVSVLYRGIPRIMKPDPSNALGLYLMCSMVVIGMTGLGHLFATLVLREKVLTGVTLPSLASGTLL
jgi:hypothetical protein